MTDLTAAHFHDASEARKYLEALRWPSGPVCPFCGSVDDAYATKRAGVYRCAAKECRKDFSVTIGTIFERSHVALDKWLLAFRLMAGSKKGMSANQLHRTLGVTHKTAWFMAHRIREAMMDTTSAPIGGEGKVIEVDETFLSAKRAYTPEKGAHKKSGSHGARHAVLTIVERKGRAKSVRLAALKSRDIENIVREQADVRSHFMTDEAPHYKQIGTWFEGHETVNHSRKEYARGDVTTNTVEGFFSIFKRGMKGIYQHCGEQHLHRYLAEFDFRYSNRAAMEIDDTMRTDLALKGAEGKRLTYSQTGSGKASQENDAP
ncbi:MAG TPA: IS1595 family transposase [Magnetospirillaceae bacterium]|jgi:transposase-like protein